MPGCWLACAGLFDENMVVEQLNAIGFHQCRRDLGDCAVANGVFEFWNAIPIAIVIEKPTFFALFQILGRIGAGL